MSGELVNPLHAGDMSFILLTGLLFGCGWKLIQTNPALLSVCALCACMSSGVLRENDTDGQLGGNGIRRSSI